MSRGSRLPNARPKLMFDHVDQSFLQIVCGLYRSPYIQNTRNFPQNLRRGIAREQAMNFAPRGRSNPKSKDGRGGRYNQTNNVLN